MQDLKPQRAVESDGSWHFVGAECNRADPLNHGQNSPVSFPRAVATGPRLATGGGRARARRVDLQTFECAILTTFAAFEDPMKSKGLGRWLQGDLHPPK